MIISEQSGVKENREKMRQIGEDQEHYGEREEPCQNRKGKFGENIRAEIKKISVEQSRASSVVQND